MIRTNTTIFPLPPAASSDQSTGERLSTASFLAFMDAKVPWTALGGLVAPVSTPAAAVDLVLPVQPLLRLHLVRRWFGLELDELHDALLESVSIKEFVGIQGAVSGTTLARAVSEFEAWLERRNVMGAVHEVCDRVLAQSHRTLVPGFRATPALQPAPRSSKLEALSRYVDTLSPPFGIREIIRFNAIYRSIYADLTSDERRQAETYVEMLMEGVDQPAHAARIFGVV